MQERTVIITAGGIGKRMGSELPKQFLLVGEKAILHHCIQAFYTYDPTIQVIVTLPHEWIMYWKHYCEKQAFTIHHVVLDGGKERFHSIQKALALATGKWIAIHDGVRPLVPQDVIHRTFQEAKKSGTAIPICPLKDSIRKVEKGHSTALLRKEYVLVQTPQVFSSELIRKAYQLDFHEGITDDASLVEEMGESISLVEGSELNIKITSPIDLKVAEVFLKQN